ncbi:hypothetical protein C8J57DRAFT_1312029, partial [Mycena rebaudengoi]
MTFGPCSRYRLYPSNLGPNVVGYTSLRTTYLRRPAFFFSLLLHTPMVFVPTERALYIPCVPVLSTFFIPTSPPSFLACYYTLQWSSYLLNGLYIYLVPQFFRLSSYLRLLL